MIRRRRTHRLTTRISCRAPGWSRSWPWPSGAGLAALVRRARPDRRQDRGEPGAEGRPAWSRGWPRARTRSMTWTCCATAPCRICSAGSGRRPRWDRSCARSPGATCASWRRWAGSCWRSWPAGRRCCPARTCWRSWTWTRCRNGSTGIRSRARRSGTPRSRARAVLVRGLNALAAVISTPLAAPVIAATRLRGGSANTARGAASLRRRGDQHRPAGRVHRDDRGPGDSAYYCAAVHRRDPPRRGVLLGHRPDGPHDQGRDRRDTRGRLDADHATRGRSGTDQRRLDLRRRDRRGQIHRVRLEERPGDHRPADRPPGPRPQPQGRRRARASCSRSGATTPCSPTRPSR